jgi:protein TonB
VTTALLGADWLTRAAWGLSAVVHVGVAAAFLGWAEPNSTAPRAIPVTVVALPASAGSSEVGAEKLPAHEAARALPPPRRPAPPQVAQAGPRPAALAVPPAAPEPPQEKRAASPTAPAAASAEPATVVAELPLPSHKPPAPVDDRVQAASEPAVMPPVEAPAVAPPQTAALPSPQPAPDPAPAGTGGPAPGSAAEVTPASLNVAGLGNPEPEYPMTSRLRGEEGSVLLEVAVSAAGTVSKIHVVQSSGHSRLDRAALEAVRRWRFAPARIGERPIDAVIRHRVVFKLDR